MDDQEKMRHDLFVRLLSGHSSRIFGFILSLVFNRNDADDIFQETSVVLWRRFDEFEEDTNFQAWACRIAYLHVMNFRRKHKKSRLLSDRALEMIAEDALANADYAEQQEEALAQCLGKLDRKDRELIEQRYYRRLASKEIAETQSKSIHSIYRSLVRIHAILLRCVKLTLATERG